MERKNGYFNCFVIKWESQPTLAGILQVFGMFMIFRALTGAGQGGITDGPQYAYQSEAIQQESNTRKCHYNISGNGLGNFCRHSTF